MLFRSQQANRFGGLEPDDPRAAQIAAWDKRNGEVESLLPLLSRAPWELRRAGFVVVRCDGGLRRAEDLVALDAEAKAQNMQFASDNSERAFWQPFYVGDARLLQRGDPLYPDKLVPRGTPVFFGAAPAKLEGSGRLQLAEWLTTPGSVQAALVARAAVNRAWQHLFGEALCRTPKELGRLGERFALPVRLPQMAYCLDNAAMIAALAHWRLAAGQTDDLRLAPRAHSAIGRG